MIINPETALKKKWIRGVGKNMIDVETQLQQNGIDLRMGKIQTIAADQNEGVPRYEETYSEAGRFFINTGWAYALNAMERVSIPKGVAADIIGRSSLNRRGLLIRGSVYDSGFKGVCGATMYSFTAKKMQVGDRFAQMIFVTADTAQMYQGQHQNQKGNQV